MSAELEAADEVCASCGKAEVDDVKLKICTACKLVKYCSVDCQKNHRPQHKRACKKRLAEIRDDRLFRHPEESDLGECPICCLPLPINVRKSRLSSCCCKWICIGCSYANKKREWEQGLEHKCPYCREAVPNTEEEMDQNCMKRVKANDPVALCQMGKKRYHEGDYEGAFQYFTKATKFGDVDAHYQLSCLYDKGNGVEKDPKKELYHAEEAAIGGHPTARFNLANLEGRNGRHDRGLKHLIIATKQGHDEALEAVKKGFTEGLLSKEYFESALRGHQAAVDATKSTQRDTAEEFFT
jgi:tetratricopeptide (TPR) repeat protein